jgi:hypothetical protein
MAAGRKPDSGGGSGLVDSVKGALGLGGDDDSIDESELREAERLVESYAVALQPHLEDNGRWAEIRTAYLEQQ